MRACKLCEDEYLDHMMVYYEYEGYWVCKRCNDTLQPVREPRRFIGNADEDDWGGEV